VTVRAPYVTTQSTRGVMQPSNNALAQGPLCPSCVLHKPYQSPGSTCLARFTSTVAADRVLRPLSTCEPSFSLSSDQTPAPLQLIQSELGLVASCIPDLRRRGGPFWALLWVRIRSKILSSLRAVKHGAHGRRCRRSSCPEPCAYNAVQRDARYKILDHANTCLVQIRIVD